MDPIKTTDDPRLTAYALGELPPEQAAAVERFLSAHPEARAEVDALRALGDSLRRDLAAEPAPGLTDAQRASIRARAAGDEAAPGVGTSRAATAATPEGDTAPAHVTPVPRPLRLRPWRPLAAAAVLLITFGVAFGVLPGLLGDGATGLGHPTPDDEPVAGGPDAERDAAHAPREASDGPRSAGGSRRFSEDELRALQALGYTGGAPLGRSTVPRAADDRSKLEHLGYLGGATGGTSGEQRAAPRAGDDAAATGLRGFKAGSRDDFAQAEEGELRWDQSRSATTVGRSILPLDERVDAADREAPAAGVGPGAPGFLTGRGTPNPAPGEGYAPLHHNPFVSIVPGQPLTALSTFGADVDRASYANVRRFLQRNELPPPAAVRLEELVNAFTYADAPPAADAPAPFAVHVSGAPAPWAPRHTLVRVALKGRVIERAARPPVRLTFLVDVSGSMQSQDKLPLLKQSLRLLVEQLEPRDRVALVTYASGSQVVLEPTPGDQEAAIFAALDALRAGGSTHGSAGLELAYATAEQQRDPEAVDRVILCTDGDFNVGVTSQQGLHELIAAKAASGLTLTVLGFGTGNYQDVTAETLADRGNGQYAYVDGLDEAHRVFVRELTGTLVTIAQDVKLQLEFNPARVAAWRQLGYENRQIAAQEFRDDRRDAGEIGAGHAVVAYYELVPVGVDTLQGTAELRYQDRPEPARPDPDADWLTVNLRWKPPESTPDTPASEFAVPFAGPVAERFADADDDFRFGAAVLAFGMHLRQSPHRGELPLAAVHAIAQGARGDDPQGDRAELAKLVLRAQGLLPDAMPALDPEARRRLQELGYLGDPGDG